MTTGGMSRKKLKYNRLQGWGEGSMVVVDGLQPYLPLPQRLHGRLRGSNNQPSLGLHRRLVNDDIRNFLNITREPRGLKRSRNVMEPDSSLENNTFEENYGSPGKMRRKGSNRSRSTSRTISTDYEDRKEGTRLLTVHEVLMMKGGKNKPEGGFTSTPPRRSKRPTARGIPGKLSPSITRFFTKGGTTTPPVGAKVERTGREVDKQLGVVPSVPGMVKQVSQLFTNNDFDVTSQNVPASVSLGQKYGVPATQVLDSAHRAADYIEEGEERRIPAWLQAQRRREGRGLVKTWNSLLEERNVLENGQCDDRTTVHRGKIRGEEKNTFTQSEIHTEDFALGNPDVTCVAQGNGIDLFHTAWT